MARSHQEFTYVLYRQKNSRQRGSTDCSLARQIFSLVKDTQVNLLAVLTYSSLSSYVLLTFSKQKKSSIFQSVFQKPSLKPVFCSMKSFQAAGWPRLATTFTLTGIQFTGIHEKDPMVKIHLSPVSQIQFPTKGTNTARWLQINKRKLVQVRTSSLTCYLLHIQ